MVVDLVSYTAPGADLDVVLLGTHGLRMFEGKILVVVRRAGAG